MIPNKKLEGAFSEAEWELLCDQCGICCLYKIEDADTHEFFYTRLVCPLLDRHTLRCRQYARRFEKMPSCVKISPQSLADTAVWLPHHCAYRCLYEGRMLPDWHPIFKDESSIAEAARAKLFEFCHRPCGSPLQQAEAAALMRSSVPLNEKKDMNQQLVKNVIERGSGPEI